MCSNTNRPKLTDFLDVQRGVMRISFEKFKIFICQLANSVRKVLVTTPKNAVRLDVSQRLTPPGLQILFRFIEQTLQPSALQVLLNLRIPELLVELLEPVSKFSHLGRW